MLGVCVRTVENPVNAHPTITTMKPGRRYMLQYCSGTAKGPMPVARKLERQGVVIINNAFGGLPWVRKRERNECTREAIVTRSKNNILPPFCSWVSTGPLCFPRFCTCTPSVTDPLHVQTREHSTG
jgi:hypothetical protein